MSTKQDFSSTSKFNTQKTVNPCHTWENSFWESSYTNENSKRILSFAVWSRVMWTRLAYLPEVNDNNNNKKKDKVREPRNFKKLDDRQWSTMILEIGKQELTGIHPSLLLWEFPGLPLGKETQAQSGRCAELGWPWWELKEIKAARMCTTGLQKYTGRKL